MYHSPNDLRICGLLYDNPEGWFTTRELAELMNVDTDTIISSTERLKAASFPIIIDRDARGYREYKLGFEAEMKLDR